ncbi:hypothetical protein B0H13DRAFT_1894222 [Mycena leptocephala]|nr:hypothetical protein B0H13DRAFT_1894222 [Mycena leptocephala]
MQIFKLFTLASALYAGVAATPLSKNQDKDIVKRQQVQDSKHGNWFPDGTLDFELWLGYIDSGCSDSLMGFHPAELWLGCCCGECFLATQELIPWHTLIQNINVVSDWPPLTELEGALNGIICLAAALRPAEMSRFNILIEAFP